MLCLVGTMCHWEGEREGWEKNGTKQSRLKGSKRNNTHTLCLAFRPAHPEIIIEVENSTKGPWGHAIHLHDDFQSEYPTSQPRKRKADVSTAESEPAKTGVTEPKDRFLCEEKRTW